MTRLLPSLLALCFFALLSACGGGGGSGGSSNPPLASGVCLAPSASTPANPASNAIPITVENWQCNGTPVGNVNTPYVSVTVCQPGTTTCQTIDHVLLDTGSFGLRILASTLALPALTSGGAPVGECAQFLSFNTWGAVQRADIHLASETASNVPIQVIGSMPSGPNNAPCAGGTASGATPLDLYANGILGVGLFSNDAQDYYSCPNDLNADSCSATTLAPSQQVQNPVPLFASDNNGVQLQLQQVAAAGALTASGTLTFGINTQSNNQLGSAVVVPTNTSGNFTTVYKNTTMPNSYIDSGSNGLFFNDRSLAGCTGSYPGFFCPGSSTSLSATLSTANSGTATVNFAVGDGSVLLNSPNYAIPTLAGAGGRFSFDWGLPFFFGRTVFVGIQGKSIVGTTLTGPLFAYNTP